MHILRMILEHVVVCRVVEFTLHQLWMVVKRTIEVAEAMILLWLFAPILKEADRICRGFAMLLLLVAAGVVSAASFNIQTNSKALRA
jgi:hypothetical protein